MNQTVYEHKSILRGQTVQDWSYFGAIPDDATITLCVSAEKAKLCRLVLHCDGLSDSRGEVYREYEMTQTEHGFTLTLTANDIKAVSPCGLYYYKYRLTFYDGIQEFGGEGVTELSPAEVAGERQLLLYAHDFHTPDFIRGGLIYHIFVDRFARSGKCPVKQGAQINEDWVHGVPEYPSYPGARIDNREFFGGDLYGVCEKLPYLSSLGVSCLYLSPVFDAASNHKYDTGDYGRVDEMFGGDEALQALFDTAKQYNISVLLDGVFNHTGDDSLYFNKKGTYPSLGAYQSKASPYYPWYYFDSYPDRYASWWGVDILPKVNTNEPSWRAYMLGEGGIIEKYIKMGAAGFRLDVADELSEDFLCELRKTVRRLNPDGLVLGEVWEDASDKIAYSARRHYLQGNELDSVMNYPLREGIICYIQSGDAAGLRTVTERLYRRYPKPVSDCLMNFLGTHDTERILTVLAGEPSDGKSNDELARLYLTEAQKKDGIRRLKTAYTVLAFLYGVPSVFYGDEAGSEGYRDPFCRRPYPWGHEENELVSYYKSVGTLRAHEPVLQEGLFEVLTAENGVFVYARSSDTETLTVAANAGTASAVIPLSAGSVLCLATSESVQTDGAALTLPPMSAAVLKRL